MANKFSRLREKMSPESRAYVDAEVEKILAEMALNEMRQSRGMSQQDLADVLNVQQPAIAKMEKRNDTSISTLRSHIEAMGGQLELYARFPEGLVRINSFADANTDDVQQE